MLELIIVLKIVGGCVVLAAIVCLADTLWDILRAAEANAADKDRSEIDREITRLHPPPTEPFPTRRHYGNYYTATHTTTTNISGWR
jgi:hypothetical protein